MAHTLPTKAAIPTLWKSLSDHLHNRPKIHQHDILCIEMNAELLLIFKHTDDFPAALKATCMDSVIRKN